MHRLLPVLLPALVTVTMTGGLSATTALAQETAPAEAPASPELVAEGQKVFKKCAACHQVGEGAKNRVGPELNLIVGRTAGSLPDFKYSDAMAAAGEGGLVWTAETLDSYLADPKGMLRGNKMAFVGLKSEDDRKAVIAYLEANGGS